LESLIREWIPVGFSPIVNLSPFGLLGRNPLEAIHAGREDVAADIDGWEVLNIITS
jgi:hypothetical protein